MRAVATIAKAARSMPAGIGAADAAALKKLAKQAGAAAQLLKLLGNEKRLLILCFLSVRGEMTVGELVEVLRLAQPQVSKHLRVLSDVGLVKCRAEGRRRFYRLDDEHLRPLHDWLDKYEQYWNRRLDRLDDYLTDLQRKEETT